MSAGAETIRILLCDDHRIVREGLKQILADTPDIEVAAECASGPEVLHRARVEAIDLVLLDIAIPQQDGLDVLRQIKQEMPRLPVLMLSTYPEKQYAARCYKLGAAGYLNKSADPEQLVDAIRKAAGGGLYVSAQMAETLASGLAQHAGAAPRAAHESLSHREYQVFQLIAAGRSVREIAEQLELSPNTVSTYRSRILEKTGAANDVGIAMYAVRHQLLPV
ncbi:DNA-binding response regulator [Herbaspirillum sp. BH-1]|uniref:LuxR family transcriptional regulator n=2 Tax=Herbaspirillum frisingense TaxID=92645 RepID=A0AAI9IFK8_9BURK|nr:MULTISPECIES: response regulator transcription factor [Herbaspirillum]EOA05306.1 LuxR family transcriptional regulator [Herbaspirillum frisingense GSF30]MCI1015650.1 response regulator transcription factor [Herbaspirillum sp. C7C2]MDR6583725.1 DNA-binding NarL/FixJ family response regulator [Herbaspirillum frisingense]PLY58736.1 DNA-binding response regulator [Herbaspirillum sp. BH-1]UIN20125.1 response regulator transcription factor [Herbaspirillum frisingense]